MADRGIREGILLDLMHAHKKSYRRRHFGRSRYLFAKKRNAYKPDSQFKGAAND